MRLLELLGVKNFKDATENELIDAFLAKNKNFGVAGRGSFATVLTQGNVAIKFWKSDRAYTKYVEYCLKNQSNEHLPKFLSKIKKIRFDKNQDKEEWIYYIRLEKLNPLPVSFQGVNTKLFLQKVEQAIFDDIGEETAVIFDTAMRNVESLLQNLDRKQIDMWKQFISSLINVADHFSDEDLDISMHNIMVRGNVAVITDPIAPYD